MVFTLKKNKMHAGFSLTVLLFLALSPCTDILSAQIAADTVYPPDGSITPDTRTVDDPLFTHSGDLSIPNPIPLTWKLWGRYASPRYDVYLSENRRLNPADIIAHNLAETTLPVWNLKLDTRYYWQIAIKSNSRVVRKTRRFSFTTAAPWPRMIYLDGTTNVRDIGGRINSEGRIIRQGLYYRSAEFNQNHIITPLGNSQILDLGIACEIDLRNDGENPQAVLPDPIRYFRPESDVGGLVAYQYGLQNYEDQYRDVFKVLAKRENYPVICHCRAGADRAGTVSALLEALIGCSEQQMAEDYQWTSLSVYGIRDSTGSDWRSTIAEIKSYDTVYGTVQNGTWNYLLSIGVSAEELSVIRHIILGPRIEHNNGVVQPANKNQLAQPAGGAIRYIFAGAGYIDFPNDMNKLVVYSLAGKKIFEFDRLGKTGNLKVRMHGIVRGSGIIRFIK
jgi:protein-tyrosine phosphatase